MTPRATATTDDESARHFLDAAAQLIDAMFQISPEARPKRLSAIDFPATLDWLRVEDVIRLAQQAGAQGVSRKAFHNRWPTKDAFVNDAVVHTMLFREAPNADRVAQQAEMVAIANADDVATAIAHFSDSMIRSLLSYPRSFLLLHIGPLLDHHSNLKQAILGDMEQALAPWHKGYAELFALLGVSMRPDWTVERYGLALQSMLDGFLLRSRVQRDQMAACRTDVSLFADAVVAFTMGVIDSSNSEVTTRQALRDVLQDRGDP